MEDSVPLGGAELPVVEPAWPLPEDPLFEGLEVGVEISIEGLEASGECDDPEDPTVGLVMGST